MASITEEIEAMGVQIEIIPGGCTGMCQPIDVGIGVEIYGLEATLWLFRQSFSYYLFYNGWRKSFVL